MDNETQKIITEQMKKLPKDVVEAIISVDYQAKLQEIAKRQRLMIDQAGKLEMETTLVMIGLEPLADFIGNIEREFNVNTTRAKEIAVDVSENIFKPIRESLKKMNEQMQDGGEESEEINDSNNSDSVGVDLDRDKILNEIENPIPNHITPIQKPVEETKTTEIEIRPAQELETIPGQEAKTVIKEDIKEQIINPLESKMTGITVSPQQIVNAKPEIKLPEIEKKKPISNIDPYREPLI